MPKKVKKSEWFRCGYEIRLSEYVFAENDRVEIWAPYFVFAEDTMGTVAVGSTFKEALENLEICFTNDYGEGTFQ